MSQTTFRKTPRGRYVFAHLAGWVEERLRRSGLTLQQWQDTGYSLAAIGIGKESAIAELRPLIAHAHEWYNQHGDSVRRYETWEAYWPVLANRIFYFVHRHAEGRIVPALAEWPGTVSEDWLALVAPEIPALPEETVPLE